MEIQYCAKCQKRVSSVDINAGDGVKFAGKYYCEDCVVKYKIREQLEAAVAKKHGINPKAETVIKPVQPVSDPVPAEDEALEPVEEELPMDEEENYEEEEETTEEPSPVSADKPKSKWKPTTGVDELLGDGPGEAVKPTPRNKSPMPMIMVIVGVIVLVSAMAAVILGDRKSTGFKTRKNIKKVSTPYSGTPITIPGRFEAEHYDKGGDGVAYSDSDGMNQGNFVGVKFRPDEGVDMAKCLDSGGGICVSLIEKNEWVAYTISVPQDGRYDILLRVNSSSFDIIVDPQINGTSVLSNPKAWNPLGDPDAWVTAPIKGVSLKKGEQVLKLVFGSTGWNLNWIEITKSE